MTTHLTNTFTSARLLAAAITSILLLGVLAPTGFSGTSDGFLNSSNTPLIGPQPTITTFDAPGAGTGPGQGTPPFAINPTGAIAGRYIDASDAFHGFLRTPEGAITTVDVPGAGTGPGQGTRASNINPSDAVAGRYIDPSDVSHGFLRASDGTIATFDAPNAGTGPGQGTIVFSVDCLNPAGAITPTSLDANNVFHGVLRAPDGTMTTFDVPGAGTSPFQGTLTFGIDPPGTIEGDYVDSSDVTHGFARFPAQPPALCRTITRRPGSDGVGRS